MPVKITKFSELTEAGFDNNRIRERKPIAFPHENPVVPPFSTLFYWSFAWSEEAGLIGDHPHQGFEIGSFVFKVKSSATIAKLKNGSG